QNPLNLKTKTKCLHSGSGCHGGVDPGSKLPFTSRGTKTDKLSSQETRAMNKLMLTFVATTTLAVAADPFVGTWKPNTEKSKFSPGGGEFRKTSLLVLEPAGKGAYHENLRTFDGKTIENGPGSGGRTLTVDGKEHTSPDGAITFKIE